MSENFEDRDENVTQLGEKTEVIDALKKKKIKCLVFFLIIAYICNILFVLGIFLAVKGCSYKESRSSQTARELQTISDYYGDGYQQTLLHEVPAEMHHNQKYICLPIGLEGSNFLSSDGKKLVDKCIEYILGSQATIELPSLAITEFKIGNYSGMINEGENLITINVLRSDSDAMKAANPEIKLVSPLTFATPDKHAVNADGTVDFSNWHYGVDYTVSDYINKRKYNVVVRLYSPEGIENIEAGTWVNIFDIYGRKVTTTNEDLRTIDLPSGMYIVVTSDGQTVKIMR